MDTTEIMRRIVAGEGCMQPHLGDPRCCCADTRVAAVLDVAECCSSSVLPLDGAGATEG